MCDILQVPSTTIKEGELTVFNCGLTRYSFFWRKEELEWLHLHGLSIQKVEVLADMGISFVHICRWVTGGRTSAGGSRVRGRAGGRLVGG